MSGDGYYTYMERNFEIHGRLGEVIYRRKRNGKLYTYAYEYIPKYAATVLSRRSEAVARAAAGVCNPREQDYQEVVKRIYYYTPYIIYAGTYSFSCNTFYKIREKGDYEICWSGLSFNRSLSPRTKESYTFRELGSYILQCYYEGELYSERNVIVVETETVLEEVYAAWFNEHLAEILLMPVPDFASLTGYRRHITSRSIVRSLSGRLSEGVELCQSTEPDRMYFRQSADHSGNEQTQYFCEVYPRISTCWQAVSIEFKKVWEKYHNQWLDVHFKKRRKGTGVLHLWTRLVFRAAAELSFDLEELSVDNWLPGVETLGDLLETAGETQYNLATEELATNIF